MGSRRVEGAMKDVVGAFFGVGDVEVGGFGGLGFLRFSAAHLDLPSGLRRCSGDRHEQLA